MKNSFAILIIVVVLAGLFVWGYNSKKSSVASVQGVGGKNLASSLIAQESLYDFGQISMKNGNVQKDFVVSNPTASDIIVTQVITSCMCTTAFLVESDGSTKGPYGMPGHGRSVPMANALIEAGGSKTVRVVYDPNAHGPAGVGPIDRFVILTDESGGQLQLEVKAVVTP